MLTVGTSRKAGTMTYRDEAERLMERALAAKDAATKDIRDQFDRKYAHFYKCEGCGAARWLLNEACHIECTKRVINSWGQPTFPRFMPHSYTRAPR